MFEARTVLYRLSCPLVGIVWKRDNGNTAPDHGVVLKQHTGI